VKWVLCEVKTGQYHRIVLRTIYATYHVFVNGGDCFIFCGEIILLGRVSVG
jgi:hypothetical protein